MGLVTCLLADAGRTVRSLIRAADDSCPQPDYRRTMSSDEYDAPTGTTNWIAIGIVLGLPLGAALGVSVFDNLALGLLVGACVGLTLGVGADIFGRRRRSR